MRKLKFPLSRAADCKVEQTDVSIGNKEDLAFIALLKKCAVKKDLSEGSRLHFNILKKGLLRRSPHLAITLIHMYVRCECTEKAQEVLEELPAGDIVSLSSLIAAYAKKGQGREALKCFERIRMEGLSPDAVTYTCVLKACVSASSLGKGKQIHQEIMSRLLLGEDIVLGTALMDMYAKCGALQSAQQVFGQLTIRDVVSWSALISGYAQQGQCLEALTCFGRMQAEGVFPNTVTFICILTACGSVRAVNKGKHIHDSILSRDFLEKDIALGNALVDMYAKCGLLSEAQTVLEVLPIRNVISWNAMITAYVQQGQYHEALRCFECIQHEGLSPNVVTYICILKASACMGAIEVGKDVHDQIISRRMLENNVVLGTALVDMYAKCGVLAKAHKVLEELPARDLISWSALIRGYAQEGQYHDALNCFESMQSEGFSPDEIILTCILKACGSTRSLDKGKKIHENLVNQGLLGKDLMLGNAVVDMYAKCGELQKAQEVLFELPARDTTSWSALIAGYTLQGQGHEALNCFEKMQTEGLCPNAVTFICCLQACGCICAIEKGQQIHETIISQGLLDTDIMLGNALVDMYAKCGMLTKAQEVLEGLPVRDVDTWSAIIAGHAQQEQYQEGLECFEKMQGEGISPNAAIFINILKLCANVKAVNKGRQIHEEILHRGLLKNDLLLGTALLDMYAKCGMVQNAQDALKSLPKRDVVTWNALISAYTQNGQSHEALNCLQSMQSEGISPNAITFTCILKVCGSIGAIDKGKRIHELIVNDGLLETDVMLGNALVDMYAKCGFPAKAQEILLDMPVRSEIAWSAVISGYADKGQGRDALKCFKQMQLDGFCPDEVTILCILTACTHSGLLDEAQLLFGNMTSEYGISASLDHRTCMVAAFGSAGYFDKALSVIQLMPYSEYIAVWLVLLGSCKKWGNVKLGRLAFDQALQLDSSCAAAYALMSIIFAAAGLPEDARKVEAIRLKYAS